MIQVAGDRLKIQFDRFGLTEYGLFLRSKKLPEAQIVFDELAQTYRIEAPARFASLIGVQAQPAEVDDLPLPGHLFDYQAALIKIALAAKRYAIWADCGLGKTAMFLEWARQVLHRTHANVLILSPLSVIRQTVEEARKFYGDAVSIQILETREDLAGFCPLIEMGNPRIGICNYEKLIPGIMNEIRHLGGLILDESSMLKSGGGVIKWNLIKSARGIEYKLSCTATPAPNDTMEYASQASFLEKLRSEGEILWTFFTRDQKTNAWKVKPHARQAFYRFMAGWSIYLRNPARYGWADNLKDIPPPEIIEHPIEVTEEQLSAAKEFRSHGDQLFISERLGITQRSKLSQVAKGFLYLNGKSDLRRIRSLKPWVVAEIAARDARGGRQVLIWTVYDEESEILSERLTGEKVAHEALTGSVNPDDRGPMLERFRTGETAVLISKASLLGYGMNFQHCGSMIFSGWNDSYEQWYQAIRRAVRYGQTRAVKVHIPFIPELEGMILQNILRKHVSFERDTAAQEDAYIEAMKEVLR